MALGGLPLLVIQLFGRRGSSAVMRYVQEAPLGKQGGSIAHMVEGLTPIHQLTEAVLAPRSRSSPTKVPAELAGLAVEKVADQLLPQVVAAIGERAVDLQLMNGESVRALEVELGRVSRDVDVIGGLLRPTYVRCTTWADGRAHRTCTDDKTVIGYRWKAAGASPLTEACWASLPSSERCKSCSRWTSSEGP